MPVQLPPVYLPSVAHLCEAEHRRVVTLFHIEGNHMYIILYYVHNFIHNAHVIILYVHKYCGEHNHTITYTFNWALGVPRHVEVGFCKCKSDAVTLIELGYWPATPSRPNLAFSFLFLDWMEALMLESQIVVQDYCNAVEFMLKDKLNEVRMYVVCTYQILHVCVHVCTLIIIIM